MSAPDARSRGNIEYGNSTVASVPGRQIPRRAEAARRKALSAGAHAGTACSSAISPAPAAARSTIRRRSCRSGSASRTRCARSTSAARPMVSIPGGEPLIHKEMPQIVAGIVARKKFVYLCTNAILLAKHIDEYQPSPYLTFSIHLDGNRERHDESVCQEGVFDKAVAAIRLARSKGFRVTINCTLFNGENPEEVAEFFDTAMALGIEGITVSPGYSYHHAPRQDVFLGRSASKQLFREIFKRGAARRRSKSLVVQSFRAVPGFPRRQPDLPVHAVEQSRPTTSSAGSGPAICCPTKATRRATVAHRGHRVGALRRRQATRAATTAWRIAASRARRSMTRSAIRSRRCMTSLRGPQGGRPDGAGAAHPLCGRHAPIRRSQPSR